MRTLNPGAYTGVVREEMAALPESASWKYTTSAGIMASWPISATRAFVSTGSDIVIAASSWANNSGDDRMIARGIDELTAFGITNARPIQRSNSVTIMAHF